jgi:hypothetical protein
MLYMSAVGPLARSARDLRTALRATGGPEGQAAKAYAWTLPPPRHTRLENFRVGVVLDHESAPVSAEVGTVLSDAVDALARAGATVVEGWPDGVDPVRQAESFGFHVGLFFAFQQPDGDPDGEVAPLAEVVDHEQRDELDVAAAVVTAEPLHVDDVTDPDLVLLSAGADDGVHVSTVLSVLHRETAAPRNGRVRTPVAKGRPPARGASNSRAARGAVVIFRG